MAEIWPRLKKKFSCDARRKKSSKSKKVNTFASSGREKFAASLEGVQAKKKSSLVERTGVSVSAARSLSRSAQEWTASTLARPASRRSENREGSKSPEIVLSHCAVWPSDAQTRSSEHTESFSFAEARFNPECVKVEKSQVTESENVCESKFPTVGSLHGDLGNLSENMQSQGDNFTRKEVRPSATSSVVLPVKTGRCMKKMRSLQRSGWKQTSNSAFVVLVALGAFISSRFSKVGNSLAAVMTFNAVIRIWRRGKLYARFMFSSVALYFLTPLRSYLTYCPRRLSLLPRKLKVIADTRPHLSTDEVSGNLEIEVAHEGRRSNFEISVLPLESAPPAAIKQGAPVSLLLTIPEGSAPAEAPASSAIEPIPATVLDEESGTLSPSRRLAKKFSSRFKKLKMFRSSSSSSVSLLSDSQSSLTSPGHSGTHVTGSSEPGSPISPSLHSSGASSPDSHRKCPFSRRLHKSKSDIPPEFHGDEATVHAIDKKLSGKKSRLCRMSSTETLEQHNIGEITVCTNDTTPTSRSPAVEEATDASRNVSWPMVGLLVTLLFLVVGRLPAIMATSLFLLVVSNAHHDRAHPRSRGREMRASEAARKLHTSPPPRGRQHPGSPPRRH